MLNSIQEDMVETLVSSQTVLISLSFIFPMIFILWGGSNEIESKKCYDVIERIEIDEFELSGNKMKSSPFVGLALGISIGSPLTGLALGSAGGWTKETYVAKIGSEKFACDDRNCDLGTEGEWRVSLGHKDVFRIKKCIK